MARGALQRLGHRVRLTGHEPILDPAMRERVERLLDGLTATGTEPPRVEGIAARLGIPRALLDQLRKAGELVVIGPGIEYPRASWEEISERVDRMSASGPLTIARVRDELRTSRRHAEAIIGRRRAERRRGRDRRAVR